MSSPRAAALAVASLVALGVMAQAGPSPSTSLGSLIGWQTHGHDDIREWRTDMTKGAWIFKIDFNFQPEEYCTQDPNVPQPADPRGCFLLIHTPTALAVGINGANSSTDVLKFLADPANAPLLKSPARRKLFALRFYSFPPTMCDGSATSNNYLALADEFYAASYGLIDSLGLNVEFYYDQYPQAQTCIFNRWPRWASTWDQGTYDSRVYGNNGTDAKYQVFNRGEALTQLHDMAAHQWYKFANSTYPLVIYEPSDEDAINIIVDIYLSSGLNHTQGYTLAFNNDPVMFQLYTSSRSLKALHQPITHDLAYNISNVVSLRNLDVAFSWPQVTTLDVSGSGSNFLMVTAYRNGTQAVSYLVHSGAAPKPDAFPGAPPPAIVFSNYTLLSSGALPSIANPFTNTSGPNIGRPSGISSFAAGGVNYVLVSDDSQVGALYTITASGALAAVGWFKLPVAPQAALAGSSFSVVAMPGGFGGKATAVALVQAFSGASHASGPPCTVLAQLYVYDLAAPFTLPTALGAAVCVSEWSGNMKVIPITGTPVHVHVSATRALSASRCAYSPLYGNVGAPVEAYVAYGNRFGFNQVGMGSQVFLSQVCLDGTYGGASNLVIPSPAINPPVFTIGDFPSVSVVTSGNQTMVMLVSTNGACPNSFLRDDTPTGVPMMCDAYDRGYWTPVVGVLTYAYADSTEIARRLVDDASAKVTPLGRLAMPAHSPSIVTNVCDSLLLTGNYDQGYQPTASLIATPSGWIVNEVHVGLQGLAQNDCGSPSTTDGLVLDSWLLSKPLPRAYAGAYKKIKGASSSSRHRRLLALEL